MTNPMQSERPKRLVFVCVENCNRSQMAEAFARMYGAGRVEAYSAGCQPAECIHPKAIAAMQELGYDLRRHLPKGLSDLPDVQFDVVVTMGCEGRHLSLAAKTREDWPVPCPKELATEPFRAVRDLIGRKVQELLARLQVFPPPPVSSALQTLVPLENAVRNRGHSSGI